MYSDDLSPEKINGSMFHFPAIKWSHLFVVLVFGFLMFNTWLVWVNVGEWKIARVAQAAISTRVAQDRDALKTNNVNILNELKLQTFNQILPVDQQAKMAPMLLSRLDEGTRRSVRSLGLKLRDMQVIGEQQSTYVDKHRQPQSP